MSTLLRIPGHPRVRVNIRLMGGRAWIHHAGLPDELLAAGVATPEMLTPSCPLEDRFDAAGNLFHVVRVRGQRNREKRWLLCVVRKAMSFSAAAAVPGMQEALAAGGWSMPQAAVPTPKPSLRLVVDDTRGVQA